MTSTRMTLTDEEKGWALNIKKAMVEEDAALAAQVTDLEYAQHAGVVKLVHHWSTENPVHIST